MATFAINLIPDGTLSDVVALAVAAESAGVDCIRLYDEGLITHDVHVVASAIATRTATVRIGPGITNPYTRHPAQTASALASLHDLSDGRAVAGYGAGGSLTLDAMGLQRHRPLAAIADLINVSRGLWSGNTVSYAGETVSLRDAHLPGGRRTIPIWVAGRGPNVLALGAREADGVILDFLHEQTLHTSVDTVRHAAQHRSTPVLLSYSTSIVMNEADFAAVRPHMTYRLVDSPPAVQHALGMTARNIADIREAMADGLQAAATLLRDEWIYPFILHGDADQCRLQLKKLIDRHNFDEFMLPIFEMDEPHEYVNRVGELFS